MMKRKQYFVLGMAMSLAMFFLGVTGGVVMGQVAVGSGFTYQGHLQDAGQPANGTYDMEFRLYADAAAGSQIGPTSFATNVAVVDGRFTVELDFGFDSFNGDERWLQVEVENTVLSPRQSITASPYAVKTRGIHVNDDESFVGIGRDFTVNSEEFFGIEANQAGSFGYGGMYMRTNGLLARPFYGYQAGNGTSARHFLDGASGNWRLENSDGDVVISAGMFNGGFSAGPTNNGFPNILARTNGDVAVGSEGSNDYRLNVMADGFVGVGRDVPLANTEAFGVYENTSGFGGMIMETNPGGAPYYGYTTNGGQAEVHHYFDGDTGFWHLWNGDERISVGDDGYVGFGRETSIVPNDSFFDVQTPVGNNQFGGMHMATDGEGGIPYYGYAAGGTTDAFTYYNGGTDEWALRIGGLTPLLVDGPTGRVGLSTFSPAFLLHCNGSAGKPGGGNWSVASDRRLKKNINDLHGSLEKLMKLRGVTFEYNDPQSINELKGERTGWIAQEVEKVFPDWIEERNDGYKALSIRGFEALTVEALRELRKEKDDQIETLEQENEGLRERLESLEAAVANLMAQNQ